jgi:hypothetical protein
VDFAVEQFLRDNNVSISAVLCEIVAHGCIVAQEVACPDAH